MKYLLKTLAGPMYKNLVKGNIIERGKDYNDPKILDEIGDYAICVNNPALIKTLKFRYGVVSLTKDKRVNKVSLVPGDVVYVVCPSENIEDKKDMDELPQTVTIKLEEYYIKSN